MRSSWAQEGPPVLDGCGTGRQVQADAEGMDSGLPASLTLHQSRVPSSAEHQPGGAFMQGRRQKLGRTRSSGSCPGFQKASEDCSLYHRSQSPGSRGLQEDSGPGVLEAQPGQRRLKGAQQVRRSARPPPKANPHAGGHPQRPLPPSCAANAEMGGQGPWMLVTHKRQRPALPGPARGYGSNRRAQNPPCGHHRWMRSKGPGGQKGPSESSGGSASL